MRHATRKFLHTIRIAFTLVMARTFGKYCHSGFDGTIGLTYARYMWRGQSWLFPTAPLEDDDGYSL